MRQAFDLTELAQKLKGTTERKDLAKKIQRLGSTRSFQTDIESAKSALQTLGEIDKRDAVARGRFGAALMTHAIMMYCRAAIEDGRGRYKIGVARNYGADLLASHREVVKLRNKTVAHFDVGEGRYGAEWTKERVVLSQTEAGARISDLWARPNYLTRLVYDLNELCDAAHARITTLAAALEADLMRALRAAYDRDPEINAMLWSCEFHPLEFFSTKESAEAFWAEGGSVHESYQPRLPAAQLFEPYGEPRTTKV